MAEEEDWLLSADQFDLIEKEAFRKISERKVAAAAAAATVPRIPSPAVSHPLRLPSAAPSTLNLPAPTQSPSKTNHSQYRKAEVVSPPKADTAKASTSADDLPRLFVRLFLHSTGSIAAKVSYNPLLVDAFHKIPKASWHANERLWMFPISSLEIAEQVLKGMGNAHIEVHSLHPLVRRALCAACAAPDLQDLYNGMPGDIESKLMPFQREGVRFVLQHGGRALIADEMGLGKTLQAIAVASCLRDFWPVLILSPSSLRLHWAAMIQHWLSIPPADILVVLPQYGGSNRAGFNIVHSNMTKGTIHLDGVFNIISYDTVPKLQNLILALEFKIVIADESHFLKNAQAKRTSASLPIIQRSRFAILLSGTPALSRPIELYKQLEALYPDVYKNVHEYGNQYCKGGVFGLYQGASNHDELHSLMKATVMIRRLKKDVLAQLPVKRRQQVFLDLNEKDMKQIRVLFCELEVVKNRIKACESSQEVESLKVTQQNLINKIYNDSAQAKIPAVLDYLETVIEADCKFLIFAHHQPMIESIHEYLLKKKVGCIRIDGRTPASSRQAMVNDFQEKDGIKAAVLSIKAGGVGLTLTAASTVIFAELSWTPGDIIQAEDRAHRIGQVSSVNIYYLLANDTVDDIIWDVVQSKLENLGQMLDGAERTLQVSSSQTPSPVKVSQGQQPKNSPAKQPNNSPAKQLSIDRFLKRCRDASEDIPTSKKHAD